MMMYGCEKCNVYLIPYLLGNENEDLGHKHLNNDNNTLGQIYPLSRPALAIHFCPIARYPYNPDSEQPAAGTA